MDASKRQGGATLIELMATVGVVAILSVIAVPNFSSIHRNAVRTTTLNDLVRAIFLARSEAIKRNAVVSICPSVDGIRCDSTLPNWNGGWIVFENKDRDQPAELDPGEPVLHRREALTRGTLTSNRSAYSFRPFSQGDVNGTLTYCPEARATDGRAVIINHIGRPRTSDKDASGKPIKC
jgi:type IV fimbrial biogenesis protein FimT